MAHLKNPDTGTEIEVADEDVARLTPDGNWEAAGDAHHAAERRRKPTRKAADS